MIVRHKVYKYTRNTEKPWCIEWCCRHQDFLEQYPYWEFLKSYKTFSDVVEAYCTFQSQIYRLHGIQKLYYRFSKTDFNNGEWELLC